MDDPKTAMLRKCRDQFAFYATNHRDKLNHPMSTVKRDDTLRKAEVNEQLVREIDALFAEDVRSSDTKLGDSI